MRIKHVSGKPVMGSKYVLGKHILGKHILGKSKMAMNQVIPRRIHVSDKLLTPLTPMKHQKSSTHTSFPNLLL
jgi:hypothetical protein